MSPHGRHEARASAHSFTSTVQTESTKPPPIPPARFWILCVGVCLGLFLSMVDTSIVATSLYAIGTEFRDLNNVNWVALSYTLAYMGFAIVFSRISDITGRRDAFVVAYVVFVAFSLACGFAQNLAQLIAFRTLQGIGGSGLYSLSMIMLSELSPAHLRHGPIGAASLATFVLGWPNRRYLPPHEKHSWKQLDYPGAFLTVAAAVLVVFSFQNAGQTTGTASHGSSWGSAVFIAPLAVGVVCWGALMLWEYAVENGLSRRFIPVLPLGIFRSVVYTSGVINTLLLGLPYLLLIYIVPLRIQIVGDKSALLAGVMLLPMLVAVALGSIVSGAVNSKTPGITETLLAGSCLMLLGCGLSTTLSTQELDSAKLLGFIALCGMGFGLTVSSSTMIASIKVAPKHYGKYPPAQGILAQLRIFGGSLGIAASTAILRTKTHRGLLPVGKRGSQAHGSQSQLAKMTFAEAFRTDMMVATAVSGAAVMVALVAYWLRRNNQSAPDGRPQKKGRMTKTNDVEA
ncbi:MFS multidrug transporter, putative [Metarhizium acridum CQMa 102]|uniref:MFS multidrug transporter, putative n=1 Tax=Metarhizium acridum (strain CQMa 102) TaxID=655827 RepID=E9DWN1_METAQ|nr:MFS multidrug transporter, putative [Metarhizium acridum CQMa 102]EFY92081.1 MFS multidrug transporter, putative [Metarhizium acridum CQMa 102]